MREYVNTVSLNVAEIIRIDFRDVANNVTESEIKISMTYDTLKMMADLFNRAVNSQEEKLAEAKKAN